MSELFAGASAPHFQDVMWKLIKCSAHLSRHLNIVILNFTIAFLIVFSFSIFSDTLFGIPNPNNKLAHYLRFLRDVLPHKCGFLSGDFRHKNRSADLALPWDRSIEIRVFLSQNKYSLLYSLALFSEQVGVLNIRFVDYIMDALTIFSEIGIRQSLVTVLHFIITNILSFESTLR